MSLRLNGSTSGYTELDAPAVAGSNTLVLPTGNGSDGNVLGTDGAGNLSWVGGRMVLETAKASTSGTSVDFTGIPSWVKRVTVMFGGVSTNGSSAVQIQIGSGTFTTSGYVGYATRFGVAPANVYTSMSAGFVTSDAQGSGVIRYGIFVLANVSSNNWNLTGSHTNSAATGDTCLVNGNVALSGTLDRVRITTVNGTDTFDAGSLNLLLEG
jgi:hypothetical protein